VKVLTFEGMDEQISRRLVTALVKQWDYLPKGIRDALLRDASLTVGPGANDPTSLYEQIKGFLSRHRDATRQDV